MTYRIPPSMDEADSLLPLEVRRWFALRSLPGQEVKAFAGLAEQGLMAYLPFEMRWHRNRFGKTSISRPLFRGYLFVCCDTEEAPRVLDTDGVLMFVRCTMEGGEQKPMPIPPGVILGIQVEEARGVFNYTKPSKRELKRAEVIAKGFKRGEEVTVLDGPYANLMGRVLRMKNSNRTCEIEGAFGKVTLDAALLEAA